MPLAYNPDEAVQALCGDSRLGQLIERVGPFNLSLTDDWTAFQALVRSVIFQQISKSAGRSIQARLWDLFGGPPAPCDIAAADNELLRSVGLSRNKVATIRGLAESSIAGTLPDYGQLAQMDDAAIVDALTIHRGIGVWTAQMLLIFHLGRPDVLPVTDLGVRRGYRIAYALEDLPNPKELAIYGQRWKPWRSVASWYLWRANDL